MCRSDVTPVAAPVLAALLAEMGRVLASESGADPREILIGPVDSLRFEHAPDGAELLLARSPGVVWPPVHLAGAGVAQFEARLLPALGSRVHHRLHYRCADTSITSMVARVPKVDGPDPGDGLELDVQAGVDVVRATCEVHRAAADVRVAWATARAVRDRPPLA